MRNSYPRKVLRPKWEEGTISTNWKFSRRLKMDRIIRGWRAYLKRTNNLA
jgi:hypothetical protein